MGVRQENLPAVAEPDMDDWLIVIANKSISTES